MDDKEIPFNNLPPHEDVPFRNTTTHRVPYTKNEFRNEGNVVIPILKKPDIVNGRVYSGDECVANRIIERMNMYSEHLPLLKRYGCLYEIVHTTKILMKKTSGRFKIQDAFCMAILSYHAMRFKMHEFLRGWRKIRANRGSKRSFMTLMEMLRDVNIPRYTFYHTTRERLVHFEKVYMSNAYKMYGKKVRGLWNNPIIFWRKVWKVVKYLNNKVKYSGSNVRISACCIVYASGLIVSAKYSKKPPWNDRYDFGEAVGKKITGFPRLLTGLLQMVPHT